MRSITLVAGLLLAVCAAAAAPQGGVVGINVVLKVQPSQAVLAGLSAYGKVRDVVVGLNAVTLQADSGKLAAIQALPYVLAANPDAERNGAPVDTVAVSDFTGGLSTWDLDAINVTDFGFKNRLPVEDGSGVYVAVLDTGLVSSWRQYFPQERIAAEYARSFGGGGGDMGTVSSQPNKWEDDQDSHGTHVTSTILGYMFGATPVNGVAPGANVIPVKVLNQSGHGWSSVIARGIEYVGELKAGPLKNSPVVINMSLGGPALDAMEKAAIDYAIAQGVIVIASAGNEGEAGMGYPGAYAPVISVAAAGWVGEWGPSPTLPWYFGNVPDDNSSANFYIADFSSRQKAGQQLDVAAPGTWVLGPYQVNSGQTSYYFLGGTSMASPHVAGVVALMAQQDAALNAAEAEATLKSTALKLPAGCRDVRPGPGAAPQPMCWDADAGGAGLVLANRALGKSPGSGRR